MVIINFLCVKNTRQGPRSDVGNALPEMRSAEITQAARSGGENWMLQHFQVEVREGPPVKDKRDE